MKITFAQTALATAVALTLTACGGGSGGGGGGTTGRTIDPRPGNDGSDTEKYDITTIDIDKTSMSKVDEQIKSKIKNDVFTKENKFDAESITVDDVNYSVFYHNLEHSNIVSIQKSAIQDENTVDTGETQLVLSGTKTTADQLSQLTGTATYLGRGLASVYKGNDLKQVPGDKPEVYLTVNFDTQRIEGKMERYINKTARPGDWKVNDSVDFLSGKINDDGSFSGQASIKTDILYSDSVVSAGGYKGYLTSDEAKGLVGVANFDRLNPDINSVIFNAEQDQNPEDYKIQTP